MGLDDDIRLTPSAAGRAGQWSAEISPSWWTARGPLGGYVMAIGLVAMEAALADPARQPRSATMHFLRSPEAGPLGVSATVERSGRTLTSTSCRLEQDGKTIALGLAAHSTPWEGPLLDEAPMPEVDPPDARTAGRARLPGVTPPPFLERLEFHHRFGDVPFTGAEHALAGGWLGLCEPRPLDAAAIAILADAWFPAPWPRLKALAPAPTIDLTIHFRAPLPPGERLLLGRFETRLVREGFFDESGELWAPDGTLVAQSRQLGLLLGAQT